MYEKQIHKYLDTHKALILERARKTHQETGKRGYIELQTRSDPQHSLRRGAMRYVSEDHEASIQAAMNPGERTDNDIKLSEYLRTYNPASEAVVLAWYRMKYTVAKLTDTTSWN